MIAHKIRVHSPIRRVFRRKASIHVYDDYTSSMKEVEHPCEPEIANIVCSDTNVANMHLPVIDFDFDAQLVPSSTQGHHHLYINKPVTKRQYKRLLKAMVKAGLVEKGYCTSFKHRGYTAVRKPGVHKDDER